VNGFIESIRLFIDRHQLIAPGECVVVGVSGGPDSMALLHALDRLRRRERPAMSLHVAHLNHAIRGAEADEDERFVRDQAKALALPCTSERTDVPACAARWKLSIEEAARECRYAFFERVCLRTGARTLAVAHHADDNVETIVHRFFRGTGWRGLAGIRPCRPLTPESHIRLVRPLLGVRRRQILDFLAAEGVAFRQDATNDAAVAARNRIRNELLPLAAGIANPQAAEAVLRLAEQAAGLDEYLRQTAERLLETVIIDRSPEALVLNTAPILRKRRVLQTEVLRRAVVSLTGVEQDLGHRHLSALADLVAAGQSGRSLDLPGRVRATLSYGRLSLARRADDEPDEEFEIALAVPGRTSLPGLRLLIEASVEDLAPRQAHEVAAVRPDDEEWLDWDVLAPPLVVRSRRAGERFRPLGLGVEKRIAEFLLDEKIPRSVRDRVAVLADRNGVAWVIPVRIDDRARITPATRRILRLRCTTT